jgi:hypothetical protein
MPVHLRLVHAEPGSRVVEASAVERGEVLAMALAEGVTAEAAEDLARQRLQVLLAPANATSTIAARSPSIPEPGRPGASQLQASGRTVAPAPTPAPLAAATDPEARPVPAPASAVEEPAADPEDWSAELARIDLALKRIGWQRDQEGLYLERAFGHPSRSRLTTYNDLLAYLRQVEQLEPGIDPLMAPVPLRRADLLSQSDELLGQLGWAGPQGRQFLEQNLGRGSRQQLSDAELLQFNMLLEEALLAAGPAAQLVPVD